MVGKPVTARLAVIASLAALLLIGAATTASADTPVAAAAISAARWQAGEVNAAGAVPGANGAPDWGLTIDTLIALEATGVDADVARQITRALKTHVRDYTSPNASSTRGQRLAGPTAKLLYAAVITGSDPRHFGKYNLRA